MASNMQKKLPYPSIHPSYHLNSSDSLDLNSTQWNYYSWFMTFCQMLLIPPPPLRRAFVISHCRVCAAPATICLSGVSDSCSSSLTFISESVIGCLKLTVLKVPSVKTSSHQLATLMVLKSLLNNIVTDEKQRRRDGSPDAFQSSIIFIKQLKDPK